MSDGWSVLFGICLEVFKQRSEIDFDVVIDDAVAWRFPIGKCEFSSGREGLGSWVKVADETVSAYKGEKDIDKPELAVECVEGSCEVEWDLEYVHFFTGYDMGGNSNIYMKAE